MQKTIKAFVYKGDQMYVAECAEIAVVTQGGNLQEALSNLQQAVALYLEGEDLSELGFDPDPAILVTMELEPISA